MNTHKLEDDFLKLLEGYKKLVFKIVNAYCAREEDKKDLVQEIILQLWKAYPKYDDKYAISTWIYRIALNVSISFYRKQASREKSKKDYRKYYDLIHWEDTTLEPRLQQLNKHIEQLRPLDKAIIILFLEGNKNHEISDIMGISASNVSTRLNRIKGKLSKMFNKINE